MRAIVGVQVIESGTVILGHEAGTLALRDEVGCSTQSPSVPLGPHDPENIVYFGRAVGLAGQELREAVSRTLAEVDLEDHAGVLVRNLSGRPGVSGLAGLRLVGRPSLLVLDEPTVGLDPILRRDLWNHFRDLVAQGAPSSCRAT